MKDHLKEMAEIRDLKGDKFRYIPLYHGTHTSFYSGISEDLVSKSISAVQI